MKVLVACDKFKGSLTAAEACASIAAGFREGAGSDLEIRELPVADGGDGIAATLLAAMGGEWVETEVRGPLGDPVRAGFALVGGGRSAVVEMAQASGLVLLGDGERDPWAASTYGTGQLLREAAARGAGEILLGIGGSATNDGGSGMAEALGFRFEDAGGDALADLPLGLERAARLVSPARLVLPPVTVACDVVNPLLGAEGCTRVYGPQKGIAPEDFAAHEERLDRLVSLAGAAGHEAADLPGAGAAGGLGFGAVVFLGAKLVPGFDLVAGRIGLESAVLWADLVVTGEGGLDDQSLRGKGPHGVVRLARRLGKPTAAFCGCLGATGLEEEFGEIVEIRDPAASLSENLARGGERLHAAAADFAARSLRGDAGGRTSGEAPGR